MPARLTVGTYVGSIDKLKGKTALLRYDEDGNLLAQFDDMTLRYHGRGMGFGWHKFDKSDFKIKKINDKGQGRRLPGGNK